MASIASGSGKSTGFGCATLALFRRGIECVKDARQRPENSKDVVAPGTEITKGWMSLS